MLLRYYQAFLLLSYFTKWVFLKLKLTQNDQQKKLPVWLMR